MRPNTERVQVMLPKTVWFVLTLGAVILGLAIKSINGYIDKNECSMSWSYPLYVPLNFRSTDTRLNLKYNIFLYREGGTSPAYERDEDVAHLGGTPVIFIPGNAGSHLQGRSMASLAAQWPEFDWFLLDLDEDLSAFHGKTLVDESQFVNEAIKYILALYQKKRNYFPDFVPPESVILVAHSMGGIVARTLFTLSNYEPGSVNTVITLGTPHAYPPVTFDRDITQLYDVVNKWWRESSDSIAMVAISGGHSDMLALPDMTSPVGLSCSNGTDDAGAKVDNIVAAQSYEVSGVQLGIDHLAMVWCGELREVIVESIANVVDHLSPDRTLEFGSKMKTLESYFKAGYKSKVKNDKSEPIYPVRHTILLGLFNDKVESNRTLSLVLPAQSSLISYHLKMNSTAKVSQWSGTEFRDYGLVKEVSLMWYAAGPYVPFEASEFYETHLTARVSADEPLSISISVDWKKTMINVLLHYRTLAASWPFALVVITFSKMLCSRNSKPVSFTHLFLHNIIAKWSGILASALASLHLMLCIPWIRNVLRAVQIPRESANIASLNKAGFDIHDLFLGIRDPWLFWIAPGLLLVALFAVSAVAFVSSLIVRIRQLIPVSQKKETKTSRNGKNITFQSIVLMALLVVLYLVPYQVVTVFIAIYQLMSVTDTTGLEFAISQLLLWTAVVDAPIIVVWLRNFNLQWTLAAASIRNLISVLPLAIWVQWFTPLHADRTSKLGRLLTMAVLTYIATYAILYGGLHAFVVHHLTNYLACWLVVAKLDQYL